MCLPFLHVCVFCSDALFALALLSVPQGYRQLQFLESQQIDTDEANLVAGMDIAMDIVRAAETVGGGISPADLLLLTSGALAERNVNAAADIARRLSLLLAPEASSSSAALAASSSGVAGAASSSPTSQQQQQQVRGVDSSSAFDPEFVLQQYESLAEMCIAQRAVQQADVVLEAAEVAGLQPSKQILAKLTAAMRGQPRRSEVRVGRYKSAMRGGRVAGGCQPVCVMHVVVVAALSGALFFGKRLISMHAHS